MSLVEVMIEGDQTLKMMLSTTTSLERISRCYLAMLDRESVRSCYFDISGLFSLLVTLRLEAALEYSVVVLIRKKGQRTFSMSDTVYPSTILVAYYIEHSY
jgi:hypothetical protein